MNTPPPRHPWLGLGLVALALGLPNAHAVILYSTGDPTANTTAPTGPLQDSGWQYQNTFLSFTGYPISSDAFVVSKHIVGSYHQGGGSATFTYLGVTYTTVARYDAPNNVDLTVLKINPAAPQGPFPSFVPLYRKSDEVGKDFVVLGRGVERGTQVDIPADATTASSPNGTFRGWQWGGNNGTQRWGENTVDRIYEEAGPDAPIQYLFSSFTPPTLGGLANEATLAVGDSSGGVFILDPDDSTWKLAALNTGVDAQFRTSSGGPVLDIALVDAGGLYDGVNPGTAQLEDTTSLDIAFSSDYQSQNINFNPLIHLVGGYHTRISNMTAWLDAVRVPESTPPPAAMAATLFAGAWWLYRRNRRG